MNRTLSALRGIQVALVAAGVVVASGPALAQETAQVTIQAERTAKVVGRSYTGVPIELVTLTRRVSYADLDLSTHTGATELEKRVSDTAKDACKQLDTLYPLTASAGGPSCVKKATDDAMVQAHAAIAAAEKGAVKR